MASVPGGRHTVGTYLGQRLCELGIHHFFAVPGTRCVRFHARDGPTSLPTSSPTKPSHQPGDYNLLLLDELLTLPPEALQLISWCVAVRALRRLAPGATN